jgi:hypothetical protein
MTEKCIRCFGTKIWRKETDKKTKAGTEKNVKLDLREVGWVGVDWIHVAQDRNQWRLPVNT